MLGLRRARGLRFGVSAAALLVGVLFAGEAAAVPDILNYSGYLTNGAGEPVTCADPDACLGMTFRLYAQPEGGTAVWEEAFPNVQVLGGVFHLLLGESQPLYVEGLGAGDLWLGVQIDDNAEMAPRQRVASSLFAVFAAEAETCGDAETLGGRSADEFTRTIDLAPVAQSGQYDDLEGLPDLSVYATQQALADHVADATAHPPAYTDEDAIAAVEPLLFSGAYEDLSGTPDLSVYLTAADLATYATDADLEPLATDADLAAHAGDAAAHHTRYTDDEARLAVEPLLFSGAYDDLTGAPDLSVYATDEAFDSLVATFAAHEEVFLDHAEDAVLHHARYTDQEAVAAVQPVLDGAFATHAGDPAAHHPRYSDDEARAALAPVLDLYALDVDVEAHAADPAAHHARYTDGEAVAALLPTLAGYATGAALAGLAADFDAHGADPAAHHARYTDDEALAAVEPFLFSGQYDDLGGVPDLSVYATRTELAGYATDGDLASHAGDASAHHARYTDQEARSALAPVLDGYVTDAEADAFALASDLAGYTTDGEFSAHVAAFGSHVAEFDVHAADAAAHHARYTDAEARSALAATLAGYVTDAEAAAFALASDLAGYVTDGEFAAHLAAFGSHVAEFDAHASDAAAHHARYTDAEAAAAVQPLLAGFATLEDLGSYTLASDFFAHLSDGTAHHPRYTDAEARTAVTPLLTPLATDADLATHAAAPAAHHPRYTDAEARAAVADLVVSAAITPKQVALKRWYPIRSVENDARPVCDSFGSAVAMESDGDSLYALCIGNGVTVEKLDASTGQRLWIGSAGCVNPGGMALDGANIWVSCAVMVQTGALQGVVSILRTSGPGFGTTEDPEFRRQQAISGTTQLGGITFDGSGAWVAAPELSQLVFVSHSGRTTDSIDLSDYGQPYPVAFGEGHVWAGLANRTVVAVDLASRAVFQTDPLPGFPSNLVFTGTLMWVSSNEDAGSSFATAFSLASPAPAFAIDLGPIAGVGQLCFDGRYVWAPERRTGDSIGTFDAVAGQQVDFRPRASIEGQSAACAFDGARVWFTSANQIFAY